MAKVNQQKKLEQFVLGSIVWGGYSDLIDMVTAEDFTSDSGKAVIGLLQDRHGAGEPTDDNILIADSMVPHTQYLLECSGAYGTKQYPKKHVYAEAERLIKWSDLRHVFDGCDRIRRSISSGAMKSTDDAVTELQLLQESTVSRHRVTRETTIGDSVYEGLRQIERNLKAGKIRFGLPTVDDFMGGGINVGEFVIIGARTNVGKSILSLYPALTTAREGKWVLLASNEMSDAQMAMRMLANVSGVSMDVIEMTRKGTKNEMESMASGIELIKTLPIAMLPNCYFPSQIAEALERRKRAGIPVSLVVLDHIQRMRSDNPRITKQYDILTEASRQMQSLSKRYDCTIISMAQINRAGTMADRVLTSHLEGSGALEQDPDKVFLMYCDKQDPQVRLLELAKNRSGMVSSDPFRLVLHGSKMRFVEHRNA